MKHQIYRVEGMSGDCNDGKEFYPLQERVQKRFPEGTEICGDEGYLFQVANSVVILSAEGGWEPRFTLVPDSKEVKSKLEKELEITLK